MSEEEHSLDVFNHLYRTALLGLCLPLANYLVSFFTPNWSTHLPTDVCATFFSDASLHRGLWVIIMVIIMSTLIMGWDPFPVQPQRRLPEHVQTGKSSLTSGMDTFSLCFSRTQLFPLALSLACLGENKA